MVHVNKCFRTNVKSFEPMSDTKVTCRGLATSGFIGQGKKSCFQITRPFLFFPTFFLKTFLDLVIINVIVYMIKFLGENVKEIFQKRIKEILASLHYFNFYRMLTFS